MDFFGVTVKALELSSRVNELTLLHKRIQTFKERTDPLNFRLTCHVKAPVWAKACKWNLGEFTDPRLTFRDLSKDYFLLFCSGRCTTSSGNLFSWVWAVGSHPQG